ncbi:unnamed protein product [Paramecium sonneborni]|uniref:Uncharacterized protein n=1 Tax=Paramecium sonneborni TaxID=65129 RepID=A0A8S1M3F6_9CILI|nr:unnamed protein product [Paramecium sonneborni]
MLNQHMINQEKREIFIKCIIIEFNRRKDKSIKIQINQRDQNETKYEELQQKYSHSIKEKMLLKLERDQLIAKNDALQRNIQNIINQIQLYLGRQENKQGKRTRESNRQITYSRYNVYNQNMQYNYSFKNIENIQYNYQFENIKTNKKKVKQKQIYHFPR